MEYMQRSATIPLEEYEYLKAKIGLNDIIREAVSTSLTGSPEEIKEKIIKHYIQEDYYGGIIRIDLTCSIMERKTNNQ